MNRPIRSASTMAITTRKAMDATVTSASSALTVAERPKIATTAITRKEMIEPSTVRRTRLMIPSIASPLSSRERG